MIRSILDKIGVGGNTVKNSPFLLRLLPSKVPWLPFQFVMSITTACNLRCGMCARNINGIKIQYMSDEVFERASVYFKNRSVFICGPGEPFMHPNIFGLIDICESQNASMNIITNANPLDFEKIEKLFNYKKVKSIIVSIDGMVENHNRVRKGGDFNKVIENIKLIDEGKKGRGLEYPLLMCNFLGTTDNINDLPRLIELIAPYINTFTLLHPIIFHKEEVVKHLNMYPKYAAKALNDAVIAAKEKSVKLDLRPLIPHASSCISPWVSTHIGINGDVYSCTRLCIKSDFCIKSQKGVTS